MSSPYEYRRKGVREAVAAADEAVRANFDAAELLINESNETRRISNEMFKQAEALKEKATTLWREGHNAMMEVCGSLPGNENVLYIHANDLRRGEWGTKNYERSIELYKQLIESGSKYAEDSTFWLASMYLKGKYNNNHKDNNHKDRNYRKLHLSDVETADAYAKKFESSNPKYYKAYLDKKHHYLAFKQFE